MNKGSIVERLCSDLDCKEPRYKCATLLLLFTDERVKSALSCGTYMKSYDDVSDVSDVSVIDADREHKVSRLAVTLSHQETAVLAFV